MMTSAQNKKVSVIIIALNEEKRLKDLFESLYEQTYKNIEVIINDDPRTIDNTKQIIETWSRRMSIIHIMKNDKPGKLGHARLEGAKVTTGEYMMHIDADMRPTPKVIEECLNLIENGADAVFINEEVIGEGYWTQVKWLEKRCYFNDEEVCSPRFFRKIDYFEVGGHNPDLAFSEDLDIKIKFQNANKKLVWAKEIMFHNEGRLELFKSMRNKFFWSQSALDFIKVQPKASLKQGNVFFRPAFIRNWKLLLKNPHLALGIIPLKAAEVIGAVSGIISVKFFKKTISYKTTTK